MGGFDAVSSKAMGSDVRESYGFVFWRDMVELFFEFGEEEIDLSKGSGVVVKKGFNGTFSVGCDAKEFFLSKGEYVTVMFVGESVVGNCEFEAGDKLLGDYVLADRFEIFGCFVGGVYELYVLAAFTDVGFKDEREGKILVEHEVVELIYFFVVGDFVWNDGVGRNFVCMFFVDFGEDGDFRFFPKSGIMYARVCYSEDGWFAVLDVA